MKEKKFSFQSKLSFLIHLIFLFCQKELYEKYLFLDKNLLGSKKKKVQ
jgi:hypothetical protein